MDMCIRFSREVTGIAFLKQVLIRFCLLNPHSQSTVETGATSNLSSASHAAGYKSLCLMAKFIISLTQETDLLPLLIQECAKWTKRSNSSRKPHLPTWPRYSDTTSESPFFKDISIPGEKRLHKAVRTAPSWLSENLKFKLLTMPVTNWSQTLAASCLCLALSLMVWPLKSKVTKPSSSVCGSGGTTSRNCARLWPDFSSRNLSNWEIVEERSGVTQNNQY